MNPPIGKNILLAVDGSQRAMTVVQYIARMVWPGVRVTLFHVFSKLPDIYWDREVSPLLQSAPRAVSLWQATREKEIRRFMEGAKTTLIQAGFKENAVAVKMEESHRGIARDVEDECNRGYDTVVMGRRGWTRLEGLLLGSVTSKLVQRLTDVHLIVAGAKSLAPRIILAVDGSAGSWRAVALAASFLQAPVEQILLLHTVRRFGLPFNSGAGQSVLSEDAIAWNMDHLRSIEPFMCRAKALLVSNGLPESAIESMVLTDVGSRAGAIAEQAREGDYGTIIVGRRGHSDVREHAMGTVAGKVLNLARGKTVWLAS